MEYIVPISVAILGFAGTALGSWMANKKNTALVTYRLEQLERKVDKHNSVIERTYELEEKNAVQDEQIKVMNHRIADLEK